MNGQETIAKIHLENEIKNLKQIISKFIFLVTNDENYEKQNGSMVAINDAMVLLKNSKYYSDEFLKEIWEMGFSSGYFSGANDNEGESALYTEEELWEEDKLKILKEEWKRENETDS